MDYKYIEQLLDKYWKAETSTEEELILKTFFCQESIPEELRKYKDFFSYTAHQSQIGLSENFEEKLLKKIQQQTPIVVKAKRKHNFFSFRTFYEAAAAIAVFVLVGLGAQRSLQNSHDLWDYNIDSYKDSYTTEQQAYKELENGLNVFKELANVDSIKINKETNKRDSL